MNIFISSLSCHCKLVENLPTIHNLFATLQSEIIFSRHYNVLQAMINNYNLVGAYNTPPEIRELRDGGAPITQFSSLLELVSAMYDYVEGGSQT